MAESIIEILARWACTLNSWKWPEDMPGKPTMFDGLQHTRFNSDPETLVTKSDFVRPILALIVAIIGDKEFLRYHHKSIYDVSDAEYEEWWSNRQSMGAEEFYEWSTNNYNPELISERNQS